jgi:hypothetical protein
MTKTPVPTRKGPRFVMHALPNFNVDERRTVAPNVTFCHAIRRKLYTKSAALFCSNCFPLMQNGDIEISSRNLQLSITKFC